MNRTPKHFPNQTFANLTAAVHPMVQFLTSNHATFTDAPGWTIVEAYANGTREVPGDPTNLDSFTGGFGWRNDVASLVVGDWIVLRSVRGGNEFQLYIELEGTATFGYILFPYDDFVTGGAAVTPPTFPTRSIGGGTAFGVPIAQTGFATSARYTVIADAGCCIFFFDAGGTSTSWGYVGDVENPGTSNPRPFCIKKDTGNVHVEHGSGDERWSFVEPFEQTYQEGTWAFFTNHAATSDVLQIDSAGDDLLGFRRVVPVGVYAFGASGGFFGYLRYTYVGHTGLGVDGTIDRRSFIFKNDESGTSGAIVMAWDRSTAFP